MQLQWKTLILLFLALGLGGFLYFYQMQNATPRLSVAKAKEQQTFSFEADQVQFLRVKTKPQKLELELREKSGQPRWWMKTQPLQKESIKAKRDKWLWPFSSKSIWNMPIGSGAVYKPAKIQPAQHAAADQEYFYKIRAGAPLRPVYGVGSFGPGRCTGTQSMNISLPIPDNLIVPDATSTPYSTPNNASAFLMPDGQTLEQFEPLARCTAGGPVYGWRNPWGGVNIYGDGIKGGHLGSGLSSIGGSIRLGELTNTQPIRHALKINLWGQKYLYYSAAVPGYRWPATNADANAAKQYHGTNPKLVLGSLLAIPPITPASLNLQTPAGKKLFSALKNYGAYVVDDAGWDAHYFCVEKGVLEEFRATYGYDFETSSGAFYDDYMKLVKALQIVDNNGAKNVGGGGTPRAPLAPPIGN